MHASTIWNDWQAHNGQKRNETPLVILGSLRQAYPEHHVTVTSNDAVLSQFAKSENAQAVLDDDEEKHYLLRNYVSEGRQTRVESGEMKDEVRFAGFKYTWNGHQFIVYYADFTVDYAFERKEQYYFILYERSKITEGQIRPKPVDDLIAASTKWNEDLHDEVYMFDNQDWTKSKQLWKSVQQSNWKDAILDETLKRDLINDVEGFFDNRAEYRDFGVPHKRGIIFHGPPGNGKSLVIKSLINSLASRPDPIPSLYVKSFHGCYREWYNIRQVFEKARQSTPCLLIFEDLDSMVEEKVRSFFLNEVDGLEDNDGLMIIGSTNYLERLDPSITKRPSRFDRKYHFALPAHEQRVRYADFWRQKLIKNEKIEFPEGLSKIFADSTDGFSFAYLKEVFISSLLAIVNAKRVGLDAPVGLDDSDSEVSVHVDGSGNEFEDNLLWRVIRKQVITLRKEMEEATEAEKKALMADKKADDDDCSSC